MAFPAYTVTNSGDAGAAFSSSAATAGLTGLASLSPLAQLQYAVGNLLSADPASVQIPAGDVLSGTFGANKAGGADTGNYTFPGSVSIAAGLTVTTALTFLSTCISQTAIATPGTYTSVTSVQFASSVSGAVLMGFGGTNDVTLKNQAGSDVLTITANTTTLNAAGAVNVSGILTFLSTCISTSPIATPGTFTAVTSVQFASSASGAVLMGFGTNDVTLKNRNGTDVLTIPASTTGVVAAGTLSVGGALTLLGGALGSSASLGIGYKVGAGGNFTQTTNRSTGLTANTICGLITTSNASLTALASATFTVTNTVVAIGDVVNISMESGSTANTSIPYVSTVAAGSFAITLYNRHATTGDTTAMLINYAILKGSLS